MPSQNPTDTSGTVAPDTPPQPRVNQVSQRIPKDVYAKYGETESHTWEYRYPGSLVHVVAPLPTKHTSPARGWWRHTKPEEAQGSLPQNGIAYLLSEADN